MSSPRNLVAGRDANTRQLPTMVKMAGRRTDDASTSDVPTRDPRRDRLVAELFARVLPATSLAAAGRLKESILTMLEMWTSMTGAVVASTASCSAYEYCGQLAHQHHSQPTPEGTHVGKCSR